MPSLAQESLKKCEIDCRAALDKFVFAGGNMPNSLSERLVWPNSLKHFKGETEPIVAGWKGAALLSQLTTFDWVNNDICV